MKTILTLAAIAAASVLVGCVATPDTTESASETNIGEARSAFLINVRSGPGFMYRIVYQIPAGTGLNVVCWTRDPYGNTWYQLGDYNYVLASTVPFAWVGMCIGVGAPGHR